MTANVVTQGPATIRHRVGIEAPPTRVFEWLGTTAGLAEWWTRDVRGDAAAGGRLEFWFGGPGPSAVMDVVEATPARRVVWRCVEGPEEWMGTELAFDVADGDGETVVLFTTTWRAPNEFLYHCSTRWAYFLLSLKAGVERGAATPWPDDAKSDRWG